MAGIFFVLIGKILLDYNILRFSRQCKTQMVISQKKLQNKAINLSSYMCSLHTLISQASFFIFLYWNFAISMNREENKKKIKISVDNTVNDLHHEIKFENCVKNKNIYFLFLEEYFIRFLRIQLLQHFFCWDRYQKT